MINIIQKIKDIINNHKCDIGKHTWIIDDNTIDEKKVQTTQKHCSRCGVSEINILAPWC